MAQELSRKIGGRLGTPDETLALFVHELRNPLAVIKGYAGALEESGGSPDPDRLVASAGAIRRAVETLESLLGDLSNAASLFGGEVELILEEVLVSTLVEETVADIGSIAPDRNLHVSIEDDAMLLVDPVKIRQVLMNLISNAVKFSPAGSDIEIVVECHGDSIQVCVLDHGPGIPLARHGELFRKFSRLGSSKDGTGLGLYISKGIALAHGGDLTLDDADNGCRFRLVLPLYVQKES